MNKEASTQPSGRRWTPEEALLHMGVYIGPFKGKSMLPLLREGWDTVEVVPKNDPKVGDVVLYRRENGVFILHRIVAVEPDGAFLIRGDNCLEGERVAPERILGQMRGYYRGGEYIPVTDARYLAYLRRLPGLKRRLRLRARLSRLRHPFRKKG